MALNQTWEATFELQTQDKPAFALAHSIHSASFSINPNTSIAAGKSEKHTWDAHE